MCQENNQLIFCTCTNDSDSTSILVEGFAWTLNRFIRTRTYDQGEPRIKGKILLPTKELNEEINLNAVLEELNSRNCFDFDYSPEEMDCMKIYTSKEQSKYKYFKVLFKNGEWQYGAHPAFTTIAETIFEGKIKRIES